MVEKKMVLHSAKISSEPLVKSIATFRTKEPIPTFVTIETMDHKSIKRIISYEEVFISVEDANAVQCTCICKEMTDPKCPEHGD